MPEVFEIYKDAREEHRFRLKAPNGETIASGEGYSTKAACLNGINSVKENCVVPERFETYQDNLENGDSGLKQQTVRSLQLEKGTPPKTA